MPAAVARVAQVFNPEDSASLLDSSSGMSDERPTSDATSGSLAPLSSSSSTTAATKVTTDLKIASKRRVSPPKRRGWGKPSNTTSSLSSSKSSGGNDDCSGLISSKPAFPSGPPASLDSIRATQTTVAEIAEESKMMDDESLILAAALAASAAEYTGGHIIDEFGFAVPLTDHDIAADDSLAIEKVPNEHNDGEQEDFLVQSLLLAQLYEGQAESLKESRLKSDGSAQVCGGDSVLSSAIDNDANASQKINDGLSSVDYALAMGLQRKEAASYQRARQQSLLKDRRNDGGKISVIDRSNDFLSDEVTQKFVPSSVLDQAVSDGLSELQTSSQSSHSSGQSSPKKRRRKRKRRAKKASSQAEDSSILKEETTISDQCGAESQSISERSSESTTTTMISKHDPRLWNEVHVSRLNQYDLPGELDASEVHFSHGAFNSFRNSLDKKGVANFQRRAK